MNPSSLAVELARALLERFLVAHAHRKRLAGGSAFGPTSEEVAVALRGPLGDAPADLAAADARVAAATAALDAALASAPSSPLARLRRVFWLEPIDVAIVSILLAPELDHDLERAFAFAIDDFTRKRIDVGFLARLLGVADDAAIDHHGSRFAGHDRVLMRLDEGAPLRRHAVVALAAITEQTPGSMRSIRLADRIVAFLRGHDTVDELVRGSVRVTREPAMLGAVVMAPELVTQIRRALGGVVGAAPRLLLAGPEGAGRAMVVEALLAERDIGAVRIDLGTIASEDRIGERFAAAIREAALRDAAAILEGGASFKDDVPRALAQAIADAAGGLGVPLVFALSTRPSWLAHLVPDLIELDVPAPSFRERLELWRRALPPPVAEAADLETVAARYAFTGATIVRVAHRAETGAKLRDPHAPKVSLEDLGDAARLTFSHRLGGMAQRIPTGFKWDDLVLPQETLDSVREVVRFARYRPILLEDWGFAAKLPYGRGVSAILAGPPGTGKTMVAQLLANELGFDLYRIDLSQVVNKYIGETEKNLARIFEEAESSHAVLFFDEADSLFAKRTEVRSSNDRYANLEVNYLLQRMETYDGVTLLATNLEQGIDEAFKRRVRFSVMFELPGERERRALWRSMFPAKAPLAAQIDWDMLARQFVMAGGYIKKAALRAALMAAEGNRAVTTADLLEAARLEYREMGRII
ncbi:MAG TPA: AAA family ATPase [Kofleriaceae bacterium]|jgi:SpoVK/Ycf46/Vps4 family AAA+-type ATPase